MPLDVLFQWGPLLAAVLTAFAISTAVGMLVAVLWAMPHPLGDAPEEPGSRLWRPDPADDGAETLDLPPAGAARRIAETLEKVV
jgi:hypothetical protein